MAATLVGCIVYISDYYRANDRKIEAFSPKRTTEVYENGYVALGSAGASIGFVFYPGGKVEYTTYIPMMRYISAEGVFCVLVEMPFNLAVFDIDAADGICEKYSDVEKWYIGGTISVARWQRRIFLEMTINLPGLFYLAHTQLLICLSHNFL